MSEKPLPRVLHIGKYLPPVPGGIETYLGDLLRVSMRHGMTVGAIVHEKKGYPKPNPDDFGGAKIYSVPTYGQVLYAPVAPSFPWQLRQAIRDFKPDILHLHMPNTSVFAALLLPEARRIPWVVHWHADVDFSSKIIPSMFHPAYRLFESRVLHRARVIVATTSEYLNASQSLVRWRQKCVVVPLGVDLKRMQLSKASGGDVDSAMWPLALGLRLLFVGRLVEYKELSFLLAVMSQVRGYCSLIIVGDGYNRLKIGREIASRGLCGSVTLFGYATPHQLSSLYKQATALCLPSSTRNEAFGLVLLEAAAHGLPIVASEIEGSGVTSVVHALGGSVLPSKSIQGWVDFLEALDRAPLRLTCRSNLPPYFDLENSYGTIVDFCYGI